MCAHEHEQLYFSNHNFVANMYSTPNRHMLNKDFEQAVVYLKSIKQYMLLNDTFNMNYAQVFDILFTV